MIPVKSNIASIESRKKTTISCQFVELSTSSFSWDRRDERNFTDILWWCHIIVCVQAYRLYWIYDADVHMIQIHFTELWLCRCLYPISFYVFMSVYLLLQLSSPNVKMGWLIRWTTIFKIVPCSVQTTKLCIMYWLVIRIIDFYWSNNPYFHHQNCIWRVSSTSTVVVACNEWQTTAMTQTKHLSVVISL